MASLADLDIQPLVDLLRAWGFPSVHAAKVLRSYYDHAGQMPLSPDAIGHTLHARVMADLLAPRTRILARREASDGTIKLLLGLTSDRDSKATSIEAVLMPSHRPDRSAGCLSSQVGCAMGCDFCASTKSGVQRDLCAGEIIEQFLHLRRESQALGRRLQTIVFMGMGEPLLNYDNVATAIRRIAGPELGALGWRQVTVSTVGIIPGIERLMRDNLGVQLAVSLHAPDDDTRAAIVPTGRKYRVVEIVEAADAYQRHTGRISNVEYCLLSGINDSPGQARLLADLLRGRRMHVNLIPYNWIGPGVSGRIYRRPDWDTMDHFARILRERGIVTHFRRIRGEEIEGACGQLREAQGLEPLHQKR